MTGQCYVNSYELLKLLSESLIKETDPVEIEKLNGLSLVHGWITPTSGCDFGKKIDHAWVEAGAFVFETSAGEVATKEIKEFYIEYQATQRERYTLAEAFCLKEKSQIYGPWDDAGRQHRGLPLLTK
jgi:hypothetical protein